MSRALRAAVCGPYARAHRRNTRRHIPRQRDRRESAKLVGYHRETVQCDRRRGATHHQEARDSNLVATGSGFESHREARVKPATEQCRDIDAVKEQWEEARTRVEAVRDGRPAEQGFVSQPADEGICATPADPGKEHFGEFRGVVRLPRPWRSPGAAGKSSCAGGAASQESFGSRGAAVDFGRPAGLYDVFS